MKVELYNTQAILDTDDDELFGKIREFFTITDKKFNPRAGHYSDESCFILPDGTLPIGLLPDALELLKDMEIEYEIIDHRRNVASFDMAKLRTMDKRFGSMREHQAEALLAYAERLITTDFKESAIFDHATNSGKSYIIAALLEALTEGYAFILVHDATLYTQLQDFLTAAGFSVGYLRGRQVVAGDVIVCMYQSVINRQMEFEPTLLWLVQEATLLIVDECHRAGGNEYYLLVNNLGVATRIGFSGTPFGMKSNAAKIRVRASFGDIAHTVSAKRLNEAGINAKMVVNLLLHVAPIKPDSKTDLEYNELYKINIIRSEDRIKLVEDTVGLHTGNIMITVNELEHAALLAERLKAKYPDAEILTLVGGQTEEALRFLRAKFSTTTEERVVLITTIWQEGANIAMDVLIYAQGGASEIELTQYIGRIGRLTAPFKFIYDFYDLAKYGETHIKERIKIYSKLGLDIKTSYEAKPGDYTPTMAARYKNLKLF